MNKSLVAALLIAFVSIMGSQQALAGYGYKNYKSYKSHSYKSYGYSSKRYSRYKSFKSYKYKGFKKFKVKWQPVSAC